MAQAPRLRGSPPRFTTTIMPELPEVESVRRGLAERLPGLRILDVRCHRPDIVCAVPTCSAQALKIEAMRSARFTTLTRQGKHLAIATDHGSVIDVHLGMSGRLFLRSASLERQSHDHVEWRLNEGLCLVFHDPRRFGRIRLMVSSADLLAHVWNALGPDALTISAAILRGALAGTTRPIKVVLMDQRRLAGLGNIYTDEILFAARIHPSRPASTITSEETARLAHHTRRILRAAIAAGGSTIRDYRDAEGLIGGAQHLHKVYARAGQPCLICAATLVAFILAGRTTTFCSACQPRTAPAEIGSRRR